MNDFGRDPAEVTRASWRGPAAIALHVLLLIAVLSMVVFLARRHGTRVDLTSEGLYSLTGATEGVLEGLDERLRIEAYLSPDEALSAGVREARRALRSVLDEFAQRGRGRVVVRYLDPQSDADVRQRAERLGIKPQTVRDMQGTTLAQKEIWQGMRLLYGGAKQKVLPYVGFDNRTAAYEEVLTRAIQAVSVTERPRVGVMAWGSPAPSGADGRSRPLRERGRGFARVLQTDDVADRYEVVPLMLDAGQPVPADISALVLIRPRGLTDRQKFTIDQFVMRGGQLAVFADTADVALGRARSCRVSPASFDAQDSDIPFVELLEHYGLVVDDDVVFDLVGDGVPFVVNTAAPPGSPVPSMQLRLDYPYWFQPASVDWSERAEALARRDDGSVDQQLAETYAGVLQPGVSETAQRSFVPPVLFWPCSVELDEALPADVRGEVLLRTSPRAARHDPDYHQHLRPVPPGRFEERRYREFQQQTLSFLKGERELARQYGLMAMVEGRLPSFFADRPIPPVPGEAAEAEDAGDPLEEPLGSDLGDGEGSDPDDGEELQGPPADTGAEQGAEPAAESVAEVAPAGSRVIVIGDADFIRDDLVSGEYREQGGPVSRFGRFFFLNLLDWLAGNDELMALRARSFADRTQRYVDEAELADRTPRQQEEARRDAVFTARVLNVALPPLLLAGLGFGLVALRRTRKRAFLRTVGGR